MGITGLLNFVKNKEGLPSAITEGHVSTFRGKKAAIDTYSWLHKAAYGCAHDLFLGKPTTKYVDYCMKLINMLQSFNITPVLVFDGDRMPMKIVEEKRKKDRELARKQATDLLAVGQTYAAFKYIVQAIDITHEMAYNLMKAARARGIDCIVAPYEADAQLAYLEKENFVDFVITEDSDLIIFDCKKIFFKMNPDGYGEIYDQKNLEVALECKKIRVNKFTMDKFRIAAIMSGCDYVNNLPGVGLHKAWKFMNMTEITDIQRLLRKLPVYLKLPIVVNDQYVQNFIYAEFAFRYQVVFDPLIKKRVTFADVTEHSPEYAAFLQKFGPNGIDELEQALGNIDHNNRSYGNFKLSSSKMNSIFNTKISDESTDDDVSKRKFEGSSALSVNLKIVQQDNILPDYDDLQDSSNLMEYYRRLNLKAPIKETNIEPPLKKVKKCKFFKASSCSNLASTYFEKRTFRADTRVKEVVPTKQEGKENLVLPIECDVEVSEGEESLNKTFLDVDEVEEDDLGKCTAQEEYVTVDTLPSEEEKPNCSKYFVGNEITEKISPILKKKLPIRAKIPISSKKQGSAARKLIPGQASIMNYFSRN